MINNAKIDRLKTGVRSLLEKDGCEFSEEDKALLEEILLELEELTKTDVDTKSKDVMKIISLLLRFLKFFGIDNINDVF